ncbi:hypothetical protein B0H19DRAFT_1263066 [Mycena capillaripes]|nr:hypothetical protein B0H19DRAFT_1263066 [Mycena capillaripes]
MLAQTYKMFTPALADAMWHNAHTPVVQLLLNEHPAWFYPMETPTYMPWDDILHANGNSTAVIATRLSMGSLSCMSS